MYPRCEGHATSHHRFLEGIIEQCTRLKPPMLCLICMREVKITNHMEGPPEPLEVDDEGVKLPSMEINDISRMH